MKRSSPLARIYQLKLIVIGLLLVLLGLATSVLADALDQGRATERLLSATLSAISDVAFVTGAIGIAVEFFTGRDKDAADTERLRNLLKEAAPEFRDAVIAGFAETPEQMRGVATNDTLDRLAANAIALRLGDDQFARELYADVRDLAIRTPEKWYDVNVSIRLSSMDERNTAGVPLMDVLVTWEYTVTPSHPVQRFACTSDLVEFHELISDIPASSTWFMTPGPGRDASSRESYELLTFSVDGKGRKIRRTVRKSGQTYSATIGEEAVLAAKPVRIRHTYRTVAEAASHRLFIAIAQPARAVSVEVAERLTLRKGGLGLWSWTRRVTPTYLP